MTAPTQRPARRPSGGAVKVAANPTGAAARIKAGRAAFTAWLSRPLASFHLVLAIMGLLMVVGLVMVLSASSTLSTQEGGSAYSYFIKQAIFMIVGAVGFYVALRMPLKKMRALSAPFLGVCLFLLVVVLFMPPRNGSRGWIGYGPFNLQPVELAKLAFTLWGAHVLMLKRNLLHHYKHLLVPVVPMALFIFVLVMLEPDLGATVTLGAVLLSLLWFVGAPLRMFTAILGGALAGAVVLAVGASYRLDRVNTFLHPDVDPLGDGLQYTQSVRALADGGFFGRGLGEGASKWGYLPNLHTDFIFSLIGEELGFLGCIAVVGLFALLTWTGLRIAARNSDPWIRLVSATLTVWVVSQAAENIGYVVGVLPVTGVTLPLISYGGTSVVITMTLFGVLANCARHEPQAVSALRSQGPGTFGSLLRLPAPEVYRVKSASENAKSAQKSAPKSSSSKPPARGPVRGTVSNDYRRARPSGASGGGATPTRRQSTRPTGGRR